MVGKSAHYVLVEIFLLQGAAIYGMNAFMEPLCEINGWTRAALNVSLGIAAFLARHQCPLLPQSPRVFSLRALMALGAMAACRHLRHGFSSDLYAGLRFS